MIVQVFKMFFLGWFYIRIMLILMWFLKTELLKCKVNNEFRFIFKYSTNSTHSPLHLRWDNRLDVAAERQWRRLCCRLFLFTIYTLMSDHLHGIVFSFERENLRSLLLRQLATGKNKIYSWTRHKISVNRCDWLISVDNEEGYFLFGVVSSRRHRR